MTTELTANTRPRRLFGVGALALALALVLAACGVKVDTTLTFDAKGGGSRVMVLSGELDDSTKDTITGGPAEIDASIKKHLPDELEYSGMTVDGDNISGTFTLTFTSVDDYRQKVLALLAESGFADADVTMDIVTNSEGLISGTKVMENFSSEDLMGWVAEGLVVDGIVPPDEKSSVFDSAADTSIKVNIDGTEYPVDREPIRLDKTVDNGFDSVLVSILYNPEGGYSTTVYYQSLKAPSGPVKEAQDAFLEKATVSGGTLGTSVPEGNGGGTYTYTKSLTFDSADDATLSKNLQQALGTDDTQFAMKSTDPKPGSLIYGVTFSGNIDYAQVTGENSYRRLEIMVPQEWETEESARTNDDGTQTVSLSPDGPFETQFQRGITVTNLDASLDVSMNREVTQTYQVTIDAMDAANVGDAIQSTLAGADGALSVSVADAGGDQASGAASGQSGAAVAKTYTLTVNPDQQLPDFTATAEEVPSGGYQVVWDADLAQLLPGASIQQVHESVNLGFMNSFENLDGLAGLADQFQNSAWTFDGSQATRSLTAADSDAVGQLSFSASADGWTLGKLIAICVVVGVVIILIIVIVIFRKKIAKMFKGSPKPASQGTQPITASMSDADILGLTSDVAPSASLSPQTQPTVPLPGPVPPAGTQPTPPVSPQAPAVPWPGQAPVAPVPPQPGVPLPQGVPAQPPQPPMPQAQPPQAVPPASPQRGGAENDQRPSKPEDDGFDEFNLM